MCIFWHFSICVFWLYVKPKKKMFWHWNKNGWMWPCQAKERKTTHQLWHENCSLSVCIIVVNDKHSFFYLSKVKACESCFFSSPHYGCVIFFHYSPLILLNVFGYFVYTVCTCWDWCVCGAESFVFDTRVHVLYIYLFFPTCSSLKIKRNGNLKLSVICSEWAAECKHWYGPLIFSHPHGRQMTERKWGRQNNITIIIIVIL